MAEEPQEPPAEIASVQTEAAKPRLAIAKRITLPPGFDYPNGITTAPDGTLYVGSVTSGRILAIRNALETPVIEQVLEETPTVFAGTALRFDPLTNILWVASPDFLGQEINGEIIHRPHRIAAIDISRSAAIWSAAMPEGGFGNDFVLDGRGGVYLTDSFNGRIWHLAGPGAPFRSIAFDPALTEGRIGPAGIARLPSGDLVTGLFSSGALFRINRVGNETDSRVERLDLSQALENADGLALAPDGRLLVLDGGVSSGNGKLLAIDLHSGPPVPVETLADGIESPLNLTLFNGRIALTEGRVRHLLADDPALQKPERFHVLITDPLIEAPESEPLELPPHFYPESIAIDRQGRYYLGSAVNRSILRVNPFSRTVEAFVGPDSSALMSVQGLQIDENSQRLYACTANLGVHDGPHNASSLLAFDTATGDLIDAWPLPDQGFCNDLAPFIDGSLLISNSIHPRILRFDPHSGGSIEPWFEHRQLGGSALNGNGIAWSRQDAAVYVSMFDEGRLVRIEVGPNGRATDISEIGLARPLNGADAIRIAGPGRLVIFENGLRGGAGQITSAVIQGESARLARLQIDDAQPTSGIIHADTVVYATSHFEHLFGTKAGTEPGDFELRAFSLPDEFVHADRTTRQ